MLRIRQSEARMLSRAVTAISLFANVLLAGAVVYLLAYRGRSEAPPAARVAAAARAPVVQASRPLVIGRGTNGEEAKVLALAVLEAEALASVPPPSSAFWQAGRDEDVIRYQQALETERDRIRQELTERYGAGAADDPAFARLFKPVNALHAYLPSSAQLALVKLQQTRRAPPTAGAVVAPTKDAREGTVAMAERQREFERQLRAALGEAHYFEHQLREAPAAKQLRKNGGFTTEKEFRDAFRALQQMEDDRTPDAHVAGQEKLRSILGEARYTAYTARRDPRFSALEAAGARLRLKENQLMAAYGVMVRSQTELLAATAGRSPGAGSLGTQPQRIRERRDAELANLVGDHAAQDLLRTYASTPASLNPASVLQ